MKPRGLSFCALVGLFILVSAQGAKNNAQEADTAAIPAFLLAGFEAYKADGPEAAIRAWLKGSALEGSKEALTQANTLRQIQDYYGKYKTYHVICSRKVTPTTQVFFVSLDFEKGPLFARFAAFHSDDGWILVNFIFNTKDDAIVPTTC